MSGPLFGWMAHPAGSNDELFEHYGQRIGGAQRGATGNSHPRWVTHFAVADASAVSCESVRLGAEIVEPAAAGSITSIASLRSPQGVLFHVMRRDQP